MTRSVQRSACYQQIPFLLPSGAKQNKNCQHAFAYQFFDADVNAQLNCETHEDENLQIYANVKCCNFIALYLNCSRFFEHFDKKKFRLRRGHRVTLIVICAEELCNVVRWNVAVMLIIMIILHQEINTIFHSSSSIFYAAF